MTACFPGLCYMYSYFIEKLPLPAPISNFVRKTVPGNIFKELRLTALFIFLLMFGWIRIVMRRHKNNVDLFILYLYNGKLIQKFSQINKITRINRIKVKNVRQNQQQRTGVKLICFLIFSTTAYRFLNCFSSSRIGYP
mgnify:CR=1 FL=1